MLDPEVQQIKDREHLGLLGVFNYVFAGLCLFGALSVIPHLIMMQTGVFQEALEEAERQSAEQGIGNSAEVYEAIEAMETFLYVFLIIWIVFALLAAVLSFLSGRYLRSRRNRTFSMVIGALQCLAVPLGTVLGIFTFVVLGRSTVQEVYREEAGSPPLR